MAEASSTHYVVMDDKIQEVLGVYHHREPAVCHLKTMRNLLPDEPNRFRLTVISQPMLWSTMEYWEE